jgi:hypothetical protein
MIVNMSLGALAAGEQVQLSVRDTLRISLSFKYTAAEATIVTLRACPYHYVAGVIDRIGGSCSETDLELERATTSTLKEATVDMPIVPASEGGVADVTYGLIVEILGTSMEDHIDDCLVISGNPAGGAGIMDMIPVLMMVMMMGMMMEEV